MLHCNVAALDVMAAFVQRKPCKCAPSAGGGPHRSDQGRPKEVCISLDCRYLKKARA